MRLSDLIKKGQGDDSSEEKKGPNSEEAPAPLGNEAAEEEKPFRLSEMPESQTAGRKPAQPPPKEERPAASPAKDPGAEEPIPQAESPAPPPAERPKHTSRLAGADPPSEAPAKPARKARTSVLTGPDPDENKGGRSATRTEENLLANDPMRRLRQRVLDYISKTFPKVSDGKKFDLEEAEEIVVECIDTPNAMDQLYALAVSARHQHNSIAVHLFNHTIYALKLGFGLRWQEDRLIRVGVASLIHDIGMCRVSQELRHKEGKLSEREVDEVRNHPVHGYNIIMQTFGKSLGWLAEAIHQEHERENGRGYPQGLTGNDISDYAKVIGLADIYEALTHHRPHRERMLPYKAVQEIIQTQKTSFHQKLLKVMLEELSVFSLNSLVRLNSNAIGRVVQTVQGQPLRPKIQMIFDDQGTEIMEERVIDLKEFPLLYIVDSVDETELPNSG